MNQGVSRALGVARDRVAAGVHPWCCNGSFSCLQYQGNLSLTWGKESGRRQDPTDRWSMLNSPTARPGRRSAVPSTVCRLPCLPCPPARLPLELPLSCSSSCLFSHRSHAIQPIPKAVSGSEHARTRPSTSQWPPLVYLRRKYKRHVTATATGPRVECGEAQTPRQGRTGQGRAGRRTEHTQDMT